MKIKHGGQITAVTYLKKLFYLMDRLKKTLLFQKIQTRMFNRAGRLIETLEYADSANIQLFGWS